MAGQMHYGLIPSNVRPQSMGITDNVFMSAIREEINPGTVKVYSTVSLSHVIEIVFLSFTDLQLKYAWQHFYW